MASLERIGDVRMDQGDLTAASEAYKEGLVIRRELAARDPGNADWARNVWVSYWKLAFADAPRAGVHWAEAVRIMEEMAARGVLEPADAPYLEQARMNLAAARAAGSPQETASGGR